VTKAILNHWSLNSIVGAHTSQPFNIYSQNYIAGSLGQNFTERANVNPGQPVWIHSKTVPAINCSNGEYQITNGISGSSTIPVPGGKFVNPCAFNDPSSTALQGNSGRNSLRGFGYAQVDFGVHRQFPITDKVGVQFRAELFNILNHPNFSNPTSGSNAAFTFDPPPGALGNTLGFGEAPSSLASGLGGGGNTGGFNPLFQVGGPRAVQLALRIEF
jgi:hypothetical protein